MNPALVCIPTYNERENIESIVRAVLARDPRVDVLVVDDNSPDGTGAARRRAGRGHHRGCTSSTARGRQGLGKAYLAGVRLGAASAATRYVLEMDADFSHDPRYLPALLDAAPPAPTWCSARATSPAAGR